LFLFLFVIEIFSYANRTRNVLPYPCGCGSFQLPFKYAAGSRNTWVRKLPASSLENAAGSRDTRAEKLDASENKTRHEGAAPEVLTKLPL
jgi:hypothetical protein